MKLDARVARRKDGLASQREEWEADLRASLDSIPVWHDVVIASFESAGGAMYERLDDRSLLISGPNPATDVYTVVIDTVLEQITGLKVEMLADDSLPRKGPGRSTPNPNAIITDLELECAPRAGGDPTPVNLHSAVADFSQKNWDVGGAIDGDAKSGWAINPQFGKDHWADVSDGSADRFVRRSAADDPAPPELRGITDDRTAETVVDDRRSGSRRPPRRRS